MRIEEELEQARFHAEHLPLGRLLEAREADLVGHLRLRQLLLGPADHGDLGDGVDPVRDRLAPALAVGPEHVAAREPALLHRRRGQSRKADDVACRIDVRNGRLVVLVDRDPPSLVRGQAGGREVQEVRVRLPPDAVEQGVAVDLLAALETGDDAFLFVVADRSDLLPEPEGRAPLAHEVHEGFDHLGIDEIQDRRPRLDDRDLDVQGGHHRGVLEADDAGADHDQIAGEILAREKLVGVEDPLPVERHLRVMRGPRAAGDQDVLARQGDRPLRRVHLDRVRIGEPPLPVNGHDAIARELRPHDLHLPGHDLLDAEGEIGDGDLAVDRIVLAVEAPLAEAREVHDRFAERLGRDRSRVETDAADHFLAVDDGGFLPELRGGDRGLLPRRAGADDDEVVGGRIQVRKLLTRRVKQAWSRPGA